MHRKAQQCDHQNSRWHPCTSYLHNRECFNKTKYYVEKHENRQSIISDYSQYTAIFSVITEYYWGMTDSHNTHTSHF